MGTPIVTPVAVMPNLPTKKLACLTQASVGGLQGPGILPGAVKVRPGPSPDSQVRPWLG